MLHLSSPGAAPPADSLRVLVADDDPLARAALRTVLERAGMTVVAEADSGAEAILAAHAARPDLAIVDMVMPELDGLAVVRRLGDEMPWLPVLVLTAHDDDVLGVLTLRHGAAGYLGKDIDADGLLRAIAAVRAGEPAVSRRLALVLVEHLRRTREDVQGLRPVRSLLTAREWEVLDLVAVGEGTEAIAEDLVMSPETVRSHLKAIFRKLGVSSRAEAVDAAGRLRRAAIASAS